MRLRLVERKILKEDVQTTNITVKTAPSNFIKLTTEPVVYQKIQNFINKNLLQQVIEKPTEEQRYKKIKEFTDNNVTAGNIIIRAVDFYRPLSGSTRGAYDPDKAGSPSLTVKIINSDTAKVTGHEGRARSLYRWLVGDEKIEIVISADSSIVSSYEDLPNLFVSQLPENAYGPPTAFTLSKRRDFERIVESTQDKFIYIQFSSVYDGSTQKTSTEVHVSSKVFDKQYARGIDPGRVKHLLFYKLKQESPPNTGIPSTKTQLETNFELVTEPKQILGVEALSDKAAISASGKIPETLNPY